MFANLLKLQEYVSKKDLQAVDSLITTKTKHRSTKTAIHSYLMLSAHNVKHLAKIDQLDCDAVMINLEDGVSKELKPIALKLAILSLQQVKSDKKIIVRINPLDAGGTQEIEQLNKVMPDAVRVPKIKSADDVKKADTLLHPDIKLHLSIETKEAFLNIAALKIDERVETFYLGILDLFADMGLSQDLIKIDNPSCAYILSKFLIDCSCIGVDAVGFTYQDHADLDQFKRWCEFEKKMGYGAKSCISPKQVTIANEVFTPDLEALKRAKQIVKLFEDHQAKGITGFDSKAYGFIDEPIYKDALNTLNKGS